MKKSDYIKKIIRFNADKNVIRLKEKRSITKHHSLRLSQRKEARPLTALSLNGSSKAKQ